MSRKLVIVGGGALGRETYQYAQEMLAARSQATLDFSGIAGFLDDLPETPGRLRDLGVAVDFVESIEGHRVRDEFVYILGIGAATARHHIARQLGEGVVWANVIHPTAYLPDSARIGRGILLAPFSFVGIGSSIGDHTALNTYASCGHDSRIGACCVLSPYAVINGNVELADRVFMGTHAAVTPKRRVGRDCAISAGSVVVSDVPAGSLMAGNPAKGRVMYEILGDEAEEP